MFKLLVVCSMEKSTGVGIHSQVISFTHESESEKAFDRLSAIISQSTSYVREVWKLY